MTAFVLDAKATKTTKSRHKNEASTLKFFFDLLWRRKRQYFWGLVLLVCTTGLASYIPVVIRDIIVQLKAVKFQDFSGVKGLGLKLIVIAVVMAITRILSRLCFLGGSRRVGQELRLRAFARLAYVSSSFLARFSTGDVMARLTSDINVCRSVCGPGLMYFLSALTTYSASLYFMLKIDWPMTLLIFLPYPCLVIAVGYAAVRVKKHSKLAQEATGRLTAEAQETLSGIYVVKGFNLEKAQQQKFAKANQTVLDHHMTQAFLRSLIQFFVGLTSGLTALSVLWFGGSAIASDRLALADFVAFLMYLGLLVQPTVYFGWITSLLARGGPALERVTDLIDAPLTIVQPEEPHKAEVSGAVEVRGLSFRYPQRTFADETELLEKTKPWPGSKRRRLALKDISIKAEAGSVIGLFGSVGSGKSTLLKSLPRLLETAPETIFIDSVALEKWDLDCLRLGIGYVPQDGVLFSMSLRENICLGRLHASEKEIDKVLAMVCLTQDLEMLPLGLETLVGERGVTLSGGQRQRTALARALLAKPKILLLDDALSMIDAETAATILQRIEREQRVRQMTVFIAAHRTVTLLKADQIYVLEMGSVVEMGAPGQLLETQGIFATAHEQQQLQQEFEVS